MLEKRSFFSQNQLKRKPYSQEIQSQSRKDLISSLEKLEIFNLCDDNQMMLVNLLEFFFLLMEEN